MQAPESSSAVPSGAVFNADLRAWELARLDPEGVRDGECRLYREDGSLQMRCHYVRGVLSGRFEAYHPNGGLAREGAYVDGELDGAVTSFASERPGGDPLRACCVPPGATELRSRYDRGRKTSEAFFDAEGRPLRSDGRPWPERALGVPSDADFEEAVERWWIRLPERTPSGAAVIRYFDLDGTRVEDVEVLAGRRCSSRSFGPDGTLLEERHYDENGARTGHWYCRYAAPPYLDSRIVAESGTLIAERATSEFRFLDASGQLVRAAERGAPLSDEELGTSPALAGSLPSGSLLELAESLARERRIREALVAAGRALGRERCTPAFAEFFERHVVRLKPEVELERAEAVERSNPTPVAVIDGLLSGAKPARLFRLLASLLPPASSAAIELVEAALVLEPSDVRAHVTRALLRLEAGDDVGAREDTAIVARDSEEAAAALGELRRVLLPDFSFWPARDPIAGERAPELDEIALDQPLQAIKRTIQLYATRLLELRAALSMRRAERGLPAPAWLPPDTSFLLPDGPIALRAHRVTIVDETDEGEETSDVEIDERLGAVGLGMPALMRKARGDWAALTWLCWAVGLDRVALPERLARRIELGAAVDRATARCFRAHDQLRSYGLVSRSRGVPDFDWEGLSVSDLSQPLAQIAAAELLELRAMFFWLLFAQNVSPFQNDLRKV